MRLLMDTYISVVVVMIVSVIVVVFTLVITSSRHTFFVHIIEYVHH